MPCKDKHHYNDNQLLFFRKLNVLKLSIRIIRNEYKRVFKILYQKVIKLI